MVYKVYSGRVGGIYADLITAEVDASSGLPGLEMIGLLGSEVREAKDRVRVSLRNNGINIPAMKITVNLSPADERKAGAAFDLPIAVALLGVFGHIEGFNPDETLIIGELSLDGQIRPVRGILPIVRMARDKGFKFVLLPRDNQVEASLIKGIHIVPVESLSETMAVLVDYEHMTDYCYISADEISKGENSREEELDFKDVVGQEAAKRAALICAAGFHHFLMTGPPGTGKSLIARRIPTIMPRLSYEESLEVTTIYSVAGKLCDNNSFISKRPFMSPHHGASANALVGGGANVMPGMISLSHKGILFLDELAEFKRQTLDYLRQPLEDGEITVSRAKGSVKYPADFMLVAAMNPCPCGYFPDRNRCNCSQPTIARYLSKVSGPILDRIDVCVEISRMDLTEIEESAATSMGSEEMRCLVERAVAIQQKRYKDENFRFNSQIPSSKINEYIKLSKECNDMALSLYRKMQLSMRSYYKILRVARTIADLDGAQEIGIRHLAEASCYRFPDYLGD